MEKGFGGEGINDGVGQLLKGWFVELNSKIELIFVTYFHI